MILLVEDNATIRLLIKTVLKKENFDIDEAKNGEEAIEKVRNNSYSLVLMDLMLPGINGVDATKKIRVFSQTPIIFLTALTDEHSQILAYEAGADGYVTKPFSNEILKSIVKRYKSKNGNVRIYNGLEISKSKGAIFINGEPLHLPTKERELLFFLEENRGIVKNREQILDAIWGYDFEGNDRVVDKHITKLREHLGEYSKFIKTVKLLGYKFEV